MRPLSTQEVSRAWIGISEDELYLLRLSLEEEGTGYAGLLFVDDSPRLFRIRSWTREGSHVSFAMDPISASPFPAPSLSGELNGPYMDLTISGNDWERKVYLRLEERLERRWNSLRESMAEPLLRQPE